MKKIAAILVLTCCSLLSAQTAPTTPQGLPANAQKAMHSIDSEKIRATVKLLSDNSYEGRGTGQKGGDMAADSKQTQFAFIPKSGGEIALKYADDYVANDLSHAEKSEINAPIVYVGYGISAPEYKWDDYKGMDVKGKVLLMLVNEPTSDDPAFFKGRALTYYGRWTYKYEEAARRGAVGVVLVHKTEMAR